LPLRVAAELPLVKVPRKRAQPPQIEKKEVRDAPRAGLCVGQRSAVA